MGEYKIIREVGKGGMGSVSEAVAPDGQRIALKMMSAKAASHPDYREMFEHEVKSLKKLSNPAIVKIIDEPFSDSSGNLYLPMEFVEGRTISQVVQEKGPYSEQDAIAIFSKLLDAFSYIHGMECIHRDVKPSNIMIRPDGSVCVIDFGIAKDSKTSTGKTIGRIVGTDGYMSPEQANGFNIDHRTDIYSLGCLLHYMLTGSHAIPKQSNDYETICAILENNFPLVSEKGISVSEQTQKAILKSVNKNMTMRFQNAEEFKSALIGSPSAISISVGRSNCDINMPGEYVSGHHLDMSFEFIAEMCRVTIRDHSTNGTGVDGRLVKNGTFTFQYHTINTSYFPQVMLAGLPEYTLDWVSVMRILEEKRTNVHTTVLSAGGNGQDMPVAVEPLPTPAPQLDFSNISLGYGILSFVIPIAGWILGAVWKKEAPEKSRVASRLGWYGFLFNIIVSFITNVISM